MDLVITLEVLAALIASVAFIQSQLNKRDRQKDKEKRITTVVFHLARIVWEILLYHSNSNSGIFDPVNLIQELEMWFPDLPKSGATHTRMNLASYHDYSHGRGEPNDSTTQTRTDKKDGDAL